jgi:hypothetical protein
VPAAPERAPKLQRRGITAALARRTGFLYAVMNPVPDLDDLGALFGVEPVSP